MQCEFYKPLLMGYLDRELTGLEIGRVERHLQACHECQSELEGFRNLKEMTNDMRVYMPDDKYWEAYWSSVYNRLERRVGWILFSVGAILLASYGLYTLILEAFLDYNIPLVIRAGLLILTVGFCTLLVSVLRERIFLARSDKYEKVKR